MSFGKIYHYDSTTNEVTSLEALVEFEHFKNTPDYWEGHYYVSEVMVEHIVIYANTQEFVMLRKDKQTVKQAVMLFATMLGWREAAKEELTVA